MNVYQKLQIALVVLLIGLFVMFVGLDVAGYPLTEFAKGCMAAIWAIILLLVDAKSLAEIIQKSGKEAIGDKSSGDTGAAAS